MEREYDDNSSKKEQVSSTYTYRYYKAVHYIPASYKKQREDEIKEVRKSKPNGIKECRIKESEIPLHIREKLTG